MPSDYIIGLMSGTSVDGIDAVLVQFESSYSFQVIAEYFLPYSQQVQSQINALAHDNKATFADPQTQLLHHRLSEYYAQACTKLIANSAINSNRISAIANHGQTVAHRPLQTPPESLQIGDSQQLANLTGIPVISQFRQADLAEGGQGAPLMPAFHRAMAKASQNKRRLESSTKPKSVIFLNIGGIANLSIVSGTDNSQVLGFDTGPGNTLLNQWIYKCVGDDFDKDGTYAAAGTINERLLSTLLDDSYFREPYPKSTGPDYFNLMWLQQLGGEFLTTINPKDVQATLCALTVETISGALNQLALGENTNQAIIYGCGGGVRNKHLWTSLKKRLPQYTLKTTEALGISADWVEAAGFAWLGYRFLKGQTGNLPSVTGAQKKVVLGERVYPINT